MSEFTGLVAEQARLNALIPSQKKILEYKWNDTPERREKLKNNENRLIELNRQIQEYDFEGETMGHP